MEGVRAWGTSHRILTGTSNSHNYKMSKTATMIVIITSKTISHFISKEYNENELILISLLITDTHS